MKPADVGAGGKFSEVNDCASLLLRILDLPNEPCRSPLYELEVKVVRVSDGRI